MEKLARWCYSYTLAVFIGFLGYLWSIDFHSKWFWILLLGVQNLQHTNSLSHTHTSLFFVVLCYIKIYVSIIRISYFHLRSDVIWTWLFYLYMYVCASLCVCVWLQVCACCNTCIQISWQLPVFFFPSTVRHYLQFTIVSTRVTGPQDLMNLRIL